MRFHAWKYARAVLTLAVLAASAPASADARFRGEWQQGSVIRGQVEPGTRVWFKGVELQVGAAGDFVFGLDRDEGPEIWFKTQPPGAEPSSRRYPVAKRDYQIQRIDGLPQDKVEPPPAALKRIAEDQKALKAAREIKSGETGFAQDFIWPVTGRVSGVFGSQRVLNGTPKSPHAGVEVAVPTGTPLRAPADGVVRLAVPDMYYTGGTLVLDHGHGLSSVMVHLSKILAREGQAVKQGEIVAEAGMTGRATGPHLHWGMSWLGARVDPQTLVPPMPPPEAGATAR
jgi:murein DD-endopeptidase MepM/ murein hydrolase activator NlpD